MTSSNASVVFYFDIGNTNCKIGLGIGKSPLATYTIATDDRQTSDSFGFAFLEILRHHNIPPNLVSACVASSVVPGAAEKISRACKRFLGAPFLFAPEDIPIPLENRYTRPHEVGADRLVGAYAARRLFPEQMSIIAVDFGTATTFDCVEKNAYLGGLICPGVQSSIQALASNTAKLPKVSLEVEGVSPQPGRSTATSISHGFVFGFASMTEGLCTRLAKDMAGPTAIVGTGGFSVALAKVTTCFDAVYPDLLLEGLRTLYLEYMTTHTPL